MAIQMSSLFLNQRNRFYSTYFGHKRPKTRPGKDCTSRIMFAFRKNISLARILSEFITSIKLSVNRLEGWTYCEFKKITVSSQKDGDDGLKLLLFFSFLMVSVKTAFS